MCTRPDLCLTIVQYSTFTGETLEEFRTRVLLRRSGQTETAFYFGNPARCSISLVHTSRVVECEHLREYRDGGKPIWTLCVCSKAQVYASTLQRSISSTGDNGDDFVAIYVVHTSTAKRCMWRRRRCYRHYC
jgi:hypothetical protein